MFHHRKKHDSEDYDIIDDESTVPHVKLTAEQCQAQADADWQAYASAKDLAAYWLMQGDTLKAQSYNQQAAALKQSAERWERLAQEGGEK